MVNRRNLYAFVFCALFVIRIPTIHADTSTPPPPPATSTAVPTSTDITALQNEIAGLQSRLDRSESQINNEQQLFNAQQAFYTATIQAMEWVFGIFVGVLTVAGLLIGLFGLNVVNRIVEQAADTWFKKYAESTLNGRIDVEVKKIADAYDLKFGDLYRKIERAFPQKGDQ